MPKFATVGTIEVALGRRDELLPLLEAHKIRCLKDEPGTVAFEILLPHGDDTRVLCMKCIEMPMRSTCIGTDHPSHAGEKRLRQWWLRFTGRDARSWTSRPSNALEPLRRR
jgi:hypothetical protein